MADTRPAVAVLGMQALNHMFKAKGLPLGWLSRNSIPRSTIKSVS